MSSSARFAPAMSKRRKMAAGVIAVLATMLMVVTGFPLPANAAGETLDVAIRAQTGTPDWDDSDGDGNDSGPDNNVIRTNDTPIYRVDVVSNGGNADNTIVTLTLPKGQEFKSVPSFCKNPDDTSQVATPDPSPMPDPDAPLTSTSWESLPVQTLTCHIGTVQNGSTQYLSFPAWQRSEVPNGTQLESAKATVKSDYVTTPVESDDDVSMVVSAGPKWDVSKNNTAQQENSGYVQGNWQRCSFDKNQICVRYVYPLLISGPNGGKGNTPLTGPVTITDLLNPTSFYGDKVTSSQAWKDAGDGANDKYAPRLVSCGKTNNFTDTPGNNSDRRVSVRKSGDITCSQAAPGENASITIDKTDWSLYTSPTHAQSPANKPLPGKEAYAVATTVTVEVPRNAVTDLGTTVSGRTTLGIRNEFDDFTATALDGTAQPDNVDQTWNNYRTGTPNVSRPGGFDKYFIGVPGDPGNTPRSQFWNGADGPPGSGKLRDGQIGGAAGQDVVSLLYVTGTNLSNQTPGSAFLCDAWDNTRLQLHAREYPKGDGWAQSKASAGAAVWNSGSTSAVSLPDYTVQYSGDTTAGKGQGSTCRSGDWYDNPADVPGNDPALAAQGIYTAVSQVRVWTTIEQPSESSSNAVTQSYSVGLRVVPNQEAGDIMPNWASWTPNFGEEVSQEELLKRDSKGSSYNPADHTGGAGDRLIYTPAYVRIQKDVSINDGDYGDLENATGGDKATWRLQPTLNSSSQAQGQLPLPVKVEDCLPEGFIYESASVEPAVLQSAPAPDGAELTCDAGTYIRFDLGDHVPNVDIPEIQIQTRVSSVASSGTYTNVTSIQTDPKDPASFSTRSDKAQVSINQIAGLKLEKSPITPVVQVNPEGNDELEENVWQIDLANLDSPDEVRDVDVIDVLPSANGVNDSEFNGTMKFRSTTVTKGENFRVLYTSAANVNSSPDDDTNGSTGTTAWCDAPSGGTLVSGVGACPVSADQVTGLRFQRPGDFSAGMHFTAEVRMVGEGNKAGDFYTNVVEASSPSMTFNIGPLPATERVVGASVGDRVWVDSNDNGIQDDGEPNRSNFRVVLTGTDDLGNSVELETTTDDNGNYLFSNLRAGKYVVTFDPDGLEDGESFTTQSAGDDTAVDSDGDQTTGRTAEFSLSSGQARTDIDQGIIIEKGSIGDRVWIDRNRDGIQDDGEDPVEGFKVTLTGTDIYGNEVTREVTTDADGNYLFDDLLPGDYKVTFDPASLADGQAFTTQGSGGDTAADSDGDPTTGETATIKLASGENRRDIDQGVIYQTASLGDRVWLDVDGDGVQGDGEPGVEGFRVVLTGTDVYGNDVTRETTTDADGNYLFEDLDPGDYKVTFDPSSMKDGQKFTVQGSGDPAVDSDGDPTTGETAVITLAGGENRRDIDQGVLPARGSIGDHVFIDRNRDGIQDDGEDPVEGFRVVLTGTDVYGNEVTRETTTDADGNYLFDDLLEGTYKVTFDPGSLADGQIFTKQGAGDDRAKDSDGDPTTGETAEIKLGAGEKITNVDQGIIYQFASLGDKVWVDVDGDGVQGDGEPGVEGFRVVLTGTDIYGNEVSREVLTDADGNYLFENLDPGDYKVTFDPSSLKDGQTLTVQGAGDDRAVDSDGDPTTGETAVITLAAGENRRDIDQGVVPARGSIGDRVWLDSNRDGVQSDGEPGVEGLRVILTGTDVYGNEVSAETTTDANGNYLFSNLLEGDYKVTFDPAGLGDGQAFTTQGSGDDPAVDSDGDPTTGETATIKLASGENRTDIDQGIVQAASIGDRVWRDNNGDGIQDDGEPGVEGVTVILYDADGNEVTRTTTDENGNYLFENLPLGDYSVGFVLPEHFAFTTQGAGDDPGADSDADQVTGRSGTISLTADVPHNLTVDAGLVPLGSIGDTVWWDNDRDGVQGDGEPGVQGVTVILYDADGNEVTRTTTDENGKYLFSDLPMGDYSVGFEGLPDGGTLTTQGAGDDPSLDSDADPTTGRTGTVSLTPATPDVTDVDAGVLPPKDPEPNPQGSISGTVWEDLNHNGVIDDGENPIQGVTVILYDSDGNEVTRTTTDENGNYLFTDLPFGDYELEFTDIPDGYQFTVTGPDSVVDSTTGRVRVSVTSEEPNKVNINVGLERISAETNDDLPTTGGAVPFVLIGFALMALFAGGVLVAARARRSQD